VGAAAARTLAARGLRVLGLETFGAAHDQGSAQMAKILLELSMTLDGDVAGPDVSPEAPMGKAVSGSTNGCSRAGIPPPLLAWVFVAFGLYALGLFLFGITTWRAGVLPRIPAALVVFGIPLGLILDRFPTRHRHGVRRWYRLARHSDAPPTPIRTIGSDPPSAPVR
jgi:hypothetical protein